MDKDYNENTEHFCLDCFDRCDINFIIENYHREECIKCKSKNVTLSKREYVEALMKHSNGLSYDDKLKFVAEHIDFNNAKRCLKLELEMLKLEKILYDKGFKTNIEWYEDSFRPPSIIISVFNAKRKNETQWEKSTECRIRLTRDNLTPHYFNDDIYPRVLFNEIKENGIHIGEYWGCRTPKVIERFREELEKLRTDGYFDMMVNRFQHPIRYNNISL